MSAAPILPVKQRISNAHTHIETYHKKFWIKTNSLPKQNFFFTNSDSKLITLGRQNELL